MLFYKCILNINYNKLRIIKTHYSNVEVYQALKKNFLMDLRSLTLSQIYNHHPNINDKRVFIVDAQRDVLYYPELHFFSHKLNKLLKKHNYINTIRTLEDIKVLSEAFNHSDFEPKYLNHWFSEIYNLREPINNGGEPVKETLSQIKSQAIDDL